MLAANSVTLRPFQVLVGPNATGKTTFLDALQFLADVLQLGVDDAVRVRAPNFYDLCFDPSDPIAIAVEIELMSGVDLLWSVPTAGQKRGQRGPDAAGTSQVLRYEIEIGIDSFEGGLRVLRENLFILGPQADDEEDFQPSLFGFGWTKEVVHEKTPRTWRKVVGKTREGKDYFRDERTDWNNMFRFGTSRAALGSLPEDLDRFPLSIAARNLLRNGVRTLALDARAMRAPAGPGLTTKLALDGSNLPYVARALQKTDPTLFEQWVAHLGTAIHGLERVGVRERQEDKHLVLEAEFSGLHNVPVPSWLLSDGTLRLMALTLISYASEPFRSEIYLIEEPENGLHPLAIQAAYEALSAPPLGMQILCATHSPVFLAQVHLRDVLVFRRSQEGFSIVRHGHEVPELRDWTGRSNLSELFATGVLS